MAYTLLLNKDSAPLRRLALGRVQLDAGCPSITLETDGNEGLLYTLTGSVAVYVNDACLGMIGGRRSVTERHVQCVRFPAGVDFHVTLGLVGFAADLLWVTCKRQTQSFVPVSGTFSSAAHVNDALNTATTTVDMAPQNRVPYLHWNDTYWHEVGSGTHLRTVAEVSRVEGYELDVGETLNIVGGWSSVPPHASDADLARFSNGESTWEEGFFVVCEKPAIVDVKGVYTGGTIVEKVMHLHNGEAYVMPLGSHAVVAHPQSYVYYFWVYCGTALEKVYRKYSTDVGVYRT